MAGVNADGATIGVDQFQKPLEFLKALSGAVALSGGIFDYGNYSAGFVQGDSDAFGDGLKRVLEVGAQAAAGVKVQIFQAEFFNSLEFSDEGSRGILALLRGRVAQIDEIGVVGEDSLRGNLRGGEMRLKGLCLGIRDGRCAPLALVFREQSETGRGEFLGAVGGLEESARNADMGTDVFHRSMG